MSYDVLKNRLTNGVPYTTGAALERINALANNLEITQEQADEILKRRDAEDMERLDVVETTRNTKEDQEAVDQNEG